MTDETVTLDVKIDIPKEVLEEAKVDLTAKRLMVESGLDEYSGSDAIVYNVLLAAGMINNGAEAKSG